MGGKGGFREGGWGGVRLNLSRTHPIVKNHVPDEFGIGGHVVVSDHAAIPPVREIECR